MPNKTDPIQTILADARRNQILDAATKVFAEKGFHDATIRQVAKRAGIADGTIYLYFKNKDDLLLGIMDRLNETEQRPQDFAQAAQGDFEEFLTAYLRHRLVLMDENYETFQAALPDLLANRTLGERYWKDIAEPSFKLAERFFQISVEQGDVKPVDIPIAIRMVSGLFLGLLVLRMLGDTELAREWNNLPELTADMLLHGLGKENSNEHARTRTKQKTKKG
jgi:AcrR family transcriptional regulator